MAKRLSLRKAASGARALACQPGAAMWLAGLLLKAASDVLAVLEVCDHGTPLVTTLSSMSPWLASYSVGGFICGCVAAFIMVATGTRRLGARSICTASFAACNALLLYLLVASQLRHMDVYGTDPFMVLGMYAWGIAAVLAILATGVREARLRRTRRRRTLCARCGYSLRGLREPRCPECGASFAKTQVSLLEPWQQSGRR